MEEIRVSGGSLFLILLLFFWQGAAEIAVHETDLAKVKCFTAIMSMSGDQKTSWWHFLPYLEATTEEAFIAYITSSFRVDNRTGTCDLEAEMNEKGRLLSTRDVAIAEYNSTEDIKSLGKMKINMWAMGFACLDASPSSCERFTPVVLKEVGENRIAFFSLWEWDEAGGSVRNTYTARALELPARLIKPSNSSEIGLRVLRDPPELCKGLFIQEDNTISTILLNSTNFTSKIDVRVAAEAAGFSLTSKNFCSADVRKKRPLCLMGIQSQNDSSLLNVTSAQYSILQSFMSHVKDSYIQAQNSALQLKNPGTDFWVAAIALPSALIAVLAAAVPFINMQLRACPRRMMMPSRRWFNIFILCICNTIISGISYSAAIALVPSEIQKQRSFKTWGLLADQIPINKRLQVLVVIEGSSKYVSHALLAVMISVGVLLPAVVGITIYRCKQVFRRLKLLKDLRELELEYVGDDERKEGTRVDELGVIEMTNVEEHLLVKKLAKLRSLKRKASLLPPPDERGRRGRSQSLKLVSI